jgi:hypothetical protein
MSRTRSLLAAALLLFALGMPLAAADMDLVVMVDTSTSMFPYFDDLIRYLVQDLLTQRLHTGDSFHLLSFSGVPEEEMSVQIESAQDAEKAFGRLLLLQPLGRYTDLVAALHFLYRYVRELPETNPKTIILVTDGVHDPPPGSPNRGDAQSVRKSVEEVAAQIQKQGWAFHILKVPPEPVPGEEGLPSYLPDLSRVLRVPVVPYHTEDRTTISGRTTGFPALAFPADLGRTGARTSAPFRVTNYSAEPIIVKLTGVDAGGHQILERNVSVTVQPRREMVLDAPLRLPSSTPLGRQTISVKLTFADDLRISPTEGDLTFTFTGGVGIRLPRLNLLYVLFIALALAAVALLVLLFLFMRRKLREVPLAGMEKTAGAPGRPGKALPVGGKAVPPALAAPGGARAAAAGTAQPAASVRPAIAGKPAGRDGAPTRATVPLLPGAAAPGQPSEGTDSLTAAGGAAARPGQDAARRGRRLVPLMAAGVVRSPSFQPEGVRPPRPTAESLRKSLSHTEPGASTLPPMIEMRVRDQNTRIGLRNIHRILPGTSRSVGGGFSAYLVFLVSVPKGVAELRNESGRYTFVPLRREYFPGVPGPVADCLGAEIPMVTPKGMTFQISFRKWISPLEEINALMRSVPRQDW